MATINSLTQVPNLPTVEQLTLWALTLIYDHTTARITFDIFDPNGINVGSQTIPAINIDIVKDRNGKEYARTISYIPLRNNHRISEDLFWEKADPLPDFASEINSAYLRQP